jgi:hypothetical protein
MNTGPEPKIRLTKGAVQQLLDQNDGFTSRTNYEGKNFREQRDYEIRDGELHYRSRGKTSWADSRFDELRVADEEQARRFLRKNLRSLDTAGLGTPTTPTDGASRGDLSDAEVELAGLEGSHEQVVYTGIDDIDDFEDDENPDAEGGIDPRVAAAVLVVGAVVVVAGAIAVYVGVWRHRRKKAEQAAQAAADAEAGHAKEVERAVHPDEPKG